MHGVILLCSKVRILYIAPFWDKQSLLQLKTVRQRQPQLVEFIGSALDEPPFNSNETVLTDSGEPAFGTEIWKLGPPLQLIACGHTAPGCNHT
ncbi:hypothetical protein [Streptomyces sp. NBC_00005]|uniref:hypothetical protein n=1 Tax=Streptomyces sp. NBC_00005 TaxID=2903609 RepID=UPI0032440256